MKAKGKKVRESRESSLMSTFKQTTYRILRGQTPRSFQPILKRVISCLSCPQVNSNLISNMSAARCEFYTKLKGQKVP